MIIILMIIRLPLIVVTTQKPRLLISTDKHVLMHAGICDVGADEADASLRPKLAYVLPLHNIYAASPISISVEIIDPQTLEKFDIYYHTGDGVWRKYLDGFTTSPVSFACQNDGYYYFAAIGKSKLGFSDVLPQKAEAQCFIHVSTVGKTLYVDPLAKGDMSGRNWQNALPGLYQATLIASKMGGSDIFVREGVIHEYQNVITANEASSIFIYGGFAGTETSPAERIAGRKTTLDRNDYSSPAFTIGTLKEVLVDGFDILATSPASTANVIEVGSSTEKFTITNSTVHNQRIRSYGWDVLIKNCDAQVASWAGTGGTRIRIIECTSTMLDLHDTDVVSIQRCNVSQGNGLSIEGCKSALVENCEIQANSIGSSWIKECQNVQFSCCRFLRNRGAAIGFYRSGCYLNNCLFNDNDEGIVLTGNRFATIDNCTFSGNTGELGYAVYVYQEGVTIRNCVFANCKGAALQFGTTQKSGELSNSLFWNNSDGDVFLTTTYQRITRGFSN